MVIKILVINGCLVFEKKINWIKQNVFLVIIKLSEINFIILTFVSCKNIKF